MQYKCVCSIITRRHGAVLDPGDDIDLAALRELACSWALKHFGDHEIAIVYHDDNARGIPHAHIVVNNANLRTGYRMQTQHPEDLNRDLQDMAREAGLRVRPARKSNMRRLSYEWLAGLREIVIDPERAPLAYEEFRLKEYDRDRDGTWLDDIPDGNDHSIDAVRYAMMDDVLRG